MSDVRKCQRVENVPDVSLRNTRAGNLATHCINYLRIIFLEIFFIFVEFVHTLKLPTIRLQQSIHIIVCEMTDCTLRTYKNVLSSLVLEQCI